MNLLISDILLTRDNEKDLLNMKFEWDEDKNNINAEKELYYDQNIQY